MKKGVESLRDLDNWLKSCRKPYALMKTTMVFMTGDFLSVILSLVAGIGLVRILCGKAIFLTSFVTLWPFTLIFIFGFILIHLYPGLSMAPSEELRRYAIASFFSHLIIFLIFIDNFYAIELLGFILLASFIFSIPLLTAGRVFVRSLCTKRAPWWGIPVVVFAAYPSAQNLVDRLLTHPWIGYSPAIILTGDDSKDAQYRNIPIRGDLSLSTEIVRLFGISTAIIPLSDNRDTVFPNSLYPFLRHFRNYIFLVDSASPMSLLTSVRDFEGTLGLSTVQRLLYPHNHRVKLIADKLVTVIGGLFILPLFAIIAIAVKCGSKGPVFYQQKRLGLGGKKFMVWKFRTMRSDAKGELAAYLEANSAAHDEWEETYKLKNDPRVTRIGKLLRATSLDELPQLWNILRGEMSLIGPRPIVDDEIHFYGNKWPVVSSVQPGITGLWQVSGRSDTSYEERVSLDLYYIQNWSLWMDLYIFFKTLWMIVTGKGAY